MGGQPAGPVQPTEHAYVLWEKRVDALLMLLSRKDRRLVTVDELRKNIEGLGPEAYDKMTYYERWIHSISQTLIQRGVISIDESFIMNCRTRNNPDLGRGSSRNFGAI